MAIISRGGRGRSDGPPEEPPRGTAADAATPPPAPAIGTTGPSLAALRRTKPPRTTAFPVHTDLAGSLARARLHPDPVAAHVLATLAAYAYGDMDTVAAMCTRLGLESARVFRIGRQVEALGIVATCDIVQSADGAVVLVAYRGGGPAPALSSFAPPLGQPEDIRLDLPGLTPAGTGAAVLGSVYRNTWATRGAVLAALGVARSARSILDPTMPVQRPAEAIYLTGHGLGGAVALLLAVVAAAEPEYADVAGALRAVYTYGQPMAGNAAFARAAETVLGERVFRYVYRNDVVAQLPPWAAGDYAHVGQEHRYGDTGWRQVRPRREKLPPLGEVAVAAGDFLTRQHPLMRLLPFRWSLADHAPQHYVSALTPRGRPAEFGDHFHAE